MVFQSSGQAQHRLQNASRPDYQSCTDRATPRLRRGPAAGE
jgi:hypothetical protein